MDEWVNEIELFHMIECKLINIEVTMKLENQYLAKTGVKSFQEESSIVTTTTE